MDDLFGADFDGPPPAPGDPPPRLRVRLEIDRETGVLWSFHLETLGRAVPRVLDFAFCWHTPNGDGLMVPANIQVFENGAAEPSIELALDSEDDEETGELFVHFELDVPVDPEVFAIPEAD